MARPIGTGKPIRKRTQSLSDNQPATRVCLATGCGKPFASLGPANRKCPQCTRSEERYPCSKRESERVSEHG